MRDALAGRLHVVRPALLLLLALLAGCSTLPQATTARLAGRDVEYALTREGSTPVVFENGLAGRMDWWRKVQPEIGREAPTFAYNRPGMGRSAPVATPRDGAHIAAELRTLLRAQGLKPPYVLVGHSLGGLYMQYFASRYPQEVGALVLVDSAHPRLLEGEGALDRQPLLLRLLTAWLATGVSGQELDALADTGRQVLALPVPRRLPVFVLAASQPADDGSPLSTHVFALRRDLARRYPNARLTWVDSGHGIPLDRPEVVIAAIREARRVARR